MKLIACLVLTSLVIFRADGQHIDGPGAALNDGATMSARDDAYHQQQAAIAAEKAAEEAEAIAAERKEYSDLKEELDEIVAHPAAHFRCIDGVTNFDDDLSKIYGQVLQVIPDGILVAQRSFEYNHPTFTGPTVLIQHYPRRVVDEDKVTVQAQLVGSYSYNSVVGANRTIEKYDYGTPVFPSAAMLDAGTATLKRKISGFEARWEAQRQQIEAARAKAAAAKKASNDRALQANLDAAARGDAYGLMRMGERYRDGDGVGKNLAKARDWLQKAADAGSPTAKEELARLPVGLVN